MGLIKILKANQIGNVIETKLSKKQRDEILKRYYFVYFLIGKETKGFFTSQLNNSQNGFTKLSN